MLVVSSDCYSSEVEWVLRNKGGSMITWLRVKEYNIVSGPERYTGMFWEPHDRSLIICCPFDMISNGINIVYVIGYV